MSKEITSAGLRRTNIIAGIFHLLQMIAVLALSSDFSLPITAKYMSGPPGSTYAEPVVLFDTPIGLTVGIFLGLSALAHFIVASPKFFPRYSAGLAQKRNYFRWVEYSISSSVMIVLIAQVTGVSEITAIISIFGVNASMILFGWLQEALNPIGRSKTTMLPFWCGALVGITPWIAIWFNVIGADTVPGFVYGIVVAEQIFFFSFGLNQWLQYRGRGKWSNYLYGEKVYLVLSLAAKSVLAWQIYGGSLSN